MLNFNNSSYNVSKIMLLVCFAVIPGIIIQTLFFGLGTLFQIFLGVTSSIASEAMMLKLFHKKILFNLKDNTAILTGLLIAINIPPQTPWWVVMLGSSISIIFAKQLYGGLGNNLFNPAMIGYAALLVSYPIQITNWPPANTSLILSIENKIINSFQEIYPKKDNTHCKNLYVLHQDSNSFLFKKITSFSNIKITNKYISLNPIYLKKNNNISGMAWRYLNLSYLLGGIFLIWKKVISWHIPVSFLITITFCVILNWLICKLNYPIYLFSGFTMIGAFFILTDPVTTANTNSGKLIFGIIAGILSWFIRTFGKYPDGMVFAVLLSNSIVPIINYYTTYPKRYNN